ncbi:MAG: hypothetical protein M1514_01015 [Patescibacteria group bacterium]|nr:hypothetical protein [Patescibacteria group bacterium]
MLVSSRLTISSVQILMKGGEEKMLVTVRVDINLEAKSDQSRESKNLSCGPVTVNVEDKPVVEEKPKEVAAEIQPPAEST